MTIGRVSAGLMAGWFGAPVQSPSDSQPPAQPQSDSQTASTPPQSDSAPARRRRDRPLAYFDDATHAKRLVRMIYEDGLAPSEFTASDLKDVYCELMLELEWQPRPWNQLSKQLRLLGLGGPAQRKIYAWRPDARGVPRRRRVFRFLAEPPPAITATVSSLRSVA